MDIKQTKHELQNIISRKSSGSHDALIQTVTHYLRSGERASPMAQKKHQNKEKETKRLIDFAEKNQLMIDEIDQDKLYLAEQNKRFT